MSGPSSILDAQDYFSSSDADRTLVADAEFNKIMGKDADYLVADAKGKAAYKAAYNQLLEKNALNHPNNPSITRAKEAQEKVDTQGFVRNFIDTITRSHQEALSLVPMLGDAINPDGTVDPSFYERSAKYYQKQSEAPQTAERKKIDTDMAAWRISHDNGDLTAKFKAALKLTGDFLTNPEGVAMLAAESASSMTAIMAGGKAGALAGTGVAAGAAVATGGVAAPIAAVTVPVGTAVGAFGASASQAAGQEFLERVQKSLTDAKVPLTPANIQAFVENNPDLIKDHQIKSGRYGAGMGAVDMLLGGIGGKLATAPERAAVRAARATAMAPAGKAVIEGLVQSGRSLEDATAVFISAEAKAKLAGQTFKSKLGHHALNYMAEVASEPLSEAAGMISADKEIKAEDLIMETLGGIGAGPYGAIINKSLYGTKVASDKTKSFVQKVIASTPESRASAKAQEVEIKTAKAENSSPTNFGFKKDVETTEPTDPKVADWATPGHKSYDPVKAVTVLAKEENPTVDHYDKTRQVYLDYKKVVDGLYDTYEEQLLQSQALLKNGKNGEAQISADAAAKTKAIIDEKSKTLEQIAGPVNNLKTRLQEVAKTKPVPSIDPETATVDEVTDHITKALGSHGDTNVLDNAGIDKLLKRKDITEDQRTMLGALTEANIARKNVTDRATNKSVSEVRDDIYNGDAGTDFKGVDAYRQGIIHHLEAGRMEEAQKQLDGLKAFRDSHQQKSDDVTSIYNTMIEKGVNGLSEDQKAIYAQRQKENSNFKIHPIASKNYVPTIQEEARALNAEVKLAESLMTVHKNKGQVVASPEVSSTSTANPASPVVTPTDTNYESYSKESVGKNGDTRYTKDTVEGKHIVTVGAAGTIKRDSLVNEYETLDIDGDLVKVLIERNKTTDINTIKITFNNGATSETKFNGDISNEQAVKAYATGEDGTIKTRSTTNVTKEKTNTDGTKTSEVLKPEEVVKSAPTVVVSEIDYTTKSDKQLQTVVNAANHKGIDKLTPEQKDTFKTVTKEINRRAKEVEINDSTTEKTSANLSSILDPKYDNLNVTYVDLYTGEEVNDKTYAQAIENIDEEIKEAKLILECFGKSGGK